MAKGSAMGLWRGKKGSSVFYKIANSNSAQKQGIRERNYEPQNPQTGAQAGQRMRMYPAQAVYGAIKDVIERSWQGVKYGEDARREYLKRALSNPVFPAVEKGMGVVVPGPYQIAKGTLNEVPTFCNNGYAIIGITLTNMFNYDSTLGELSVDLLANNNWLANGDQITLVFCHTNVDSAGFFWDIISFYVDKDSSEDLGVIFGSQGLRSEQITFNPAGITLTADVWSIMAAACIVSREAATPLRSNATLACDYTAGDMPNYYGNSAVARAKASYMKKSTERTNSDWPADPDEGSGSGSDAPFFNVTVQASPANGGSVTTNAVDGQVANGDSVTVQAESAPNYYFSGWFKNGTKVASAALYTFVPTSDVTLVAQFILEENP